MLPLQRTYLAVVSAIMFTIGLIRVRTDPAESDRDVPLHRTDVSGRGHQSDRLPAFVFHGNLAGQAFVIFVLVIAAAEASLALGLVVLLFRTRQTLDADAVAGP